ncbi:MAG: hypothetical protein LBR51_00105 [Bacteroidales bacterium]|nr:hypothetical protein [Bacteroidales bacterium]
MNNKRFISIVSSVLFVACIFFLMNACSPRANEYDRGKPSTYKHYKSKKPTRHTTTTQNTKYVIHGKKRQFKYNH